MRVISGLVRGKKLREPSDYSIRPTTDMVRKRCLISFSLTLRDERCSTFLQAQVSSV